MKIFSVVFLAVFYGLTFAYNIDAKGLKINAIELNIRNSFNCFGLLSKDTDFGSMSDLWLGSDFDYYSPFLVRVPSDCISFNILSYLVCTQSRIIPFASTEAGFAVPSSDAASDDEYTIIASIFHTQSQLPVGNEQDINTFCNKILPVNALFKNKNQIVEMPPLSSGRIFSQALIGALGTWIGGLPPYFALQDVNREVKGDAGYSSVANLGLTIGSILGNSLGVYLIGNQDNTEGSYLITILGTTIASIPSFLLTNNPYAVYYVLTLGAVIQDIGSIIGFYKSRRFRFGNHHTNYSFPIVYTWINSSHIRISQGLELVKVQF